LKKLTEVTPYLFEEHLILALSKKWIVSFKNLPSFEVMLDEQKRLHLISKEVVKK